MNYKTQFTVQNRAFQVALAFILWLLPVSTLLASSFGVDRPRCEYLQNPIGIDTPQPRLSWILKSEIRGQKQTAYRVLVASDLKKLQANQGDLWDSGKVASDETQITYQGKTIPSEQTCYWKVAVWDRDGREGRFSTPASWEMGLMNAGDWEPTWIAGTTDINAQPAPMFRREFPLDGKIKRARFYVCGLGYYELRINGKKVGEDRLDPGYTRYDKRVLYVTHDVTAYLNKGRNVLGVMLGNGWFNVQASNAWSFDKAPWRAAPRMLCSLHIEFEDGRKLIVGSDAQWKCATGPITYDNIYGGENYDARLEVPGWDSPGFDDASWQRAKLVDAPKGKLAAQMMPPIRADGELQPVKITEPKPGVFVFDFGQNLAGCGILKVHGPPGTEIKLKYGERLGKDGTVDQSAIAQHVVRFNAKQQFQTDKYILNGRGTEKWHQHFTYYGFQYVEMTGFPGKPTPESLHAVFTHSAVPAVGAFECSNPLLNKIWRAARYSYLSNLQGIPTDCPHREKNGWTGDAHLACEQGLFNYDGVAVYEKWLDDLNDEQRPTGELPGIVPTSGWGYQWGNGPAWDSAYLLIPLYLYEYDGDTKPLIEHYDGLKSYVDYLTSRAQDGIINFGLNDWAPYETKTPTDITSTAYYYRDTQVVALAASLAGKKDDADKYTALAAQIKDAFNKHFYKPDTGLYDNGSQTALSCALYQGMVEPDNQPRVVQNLVANIAKRKDHIDTGILGSKYILNALTDGGECDVAYRMASQKDMPSWGWWIEQGATTLWEQWNGNDSRNHIMFGEIAAWFYEALAGINPDPAAPGFKHFFITPHVPGNLMAARAEYDSVRGRIASEWKLSGDKFNLHAVIPANTSATVSLPISDPNQITENGSAIGKAEGVKFLRTEKGRSVFEVEPEPTISVALWRDECLHEIKVRALLRRGARAICGRGH